MVPAPPLPPHTDRPDEDDPLLLRLQGEALYDLPPGLEARILAALPAPTQGRLLRFPQILLRVAALLLLFIGAWGAVRGSLPSLADLDVQGAVLQTTSLEVADLESTTLLSLPARRADLAGSDIPTALFLGLGSTLLVAGIVAVRRAHQQAAHDEEAA
jgi:hypothetical protein